MSMRQLKITKSITNRESQSLEKYLQEIGKVELINPEEEVKLAIQIKQGSQTAYEDYLGFADVNKGTPMDSSTTIPMASTPITSTSM